MITNIVKIIKQCARHPTTIINTIEWAGTRAGIRREYWERVEDVFRVGITEKTVSINREINNRVENRRM